MMRLKDVMGMMFRGVPAAVILLALVGCGGYTIQGKVIQGDVSGVEIVHVLDARLKSPGIEQADVSIIRDPDTLNRRIAGHTKSNMGGVFSLHVDDFGAGWMHEQWQLRTWLSKYQNADGLIKLPSKTSKVRLLITLAPGASTPPVEDEIMEQYEQFK